MRINSNSNSNSKYRHITPTNVTNTTPLQPDNETPRMKVQPIAVPSVTLHASDHRWKLGSNNFTKTPKRPKTQTAAEMITNYIIKAIFKNDLDEILVWLTSHRAFDGMEARSGERLLHTACSCGNLNLAIFFLDKGAKPDVKDGYGETPLYSCVKNRNVKIAELLLQRGAEINDGADDGVTPLALACANGDLKMVHFLLDCGANPMTPDIRGISPFFTACAQGHLEVVKVLLQMNQKVRGGRSEGSELADAVLYNTLITPTRRFAPRRFRGL